MKKGFATSGILYTVLLLFIALLFGVLQNLQNKKTILDQLKSETVNAIACDCTQILKQLNDLTVEVQTKGTLELIGTASNTRKVSYDSSRYSELVIIVDRHYSDENTQKYTFNIPVDILTDSEIEFHNGSYAAGTYATSFSIELLSSKTSSYVRRLVVNGVDQIEYSMLTVYGRKR